MGRSYCLSVVLIICSFVCFDKAVCTGNVTETRSFNVGTYGAQGDGQSVDTQAIQRTIDACHTAGGGRVVLSAGKYLSGTVHLRDGVTLYLDKDAHLVGLKDSDAYAGFRASNWRGRRWNRALIVGEGLSRIAITGPGLIDGNKVFDPQGEEKMRGPHTIMLLECRDVTLRDITIRDSANYAFLFYASADVLVKNVLFEGGWDGIHWRGDGIRSDSVRWNRNIRISGCKFYTGDDCIAGHYIEDAVVEDCVINSSCNGVRLIGPAKRLTFARCEFFGPGRYEHRTSQQLHRTNMLAGLLIQPSAWTPTPGPVENLHISDITMQNVACALHVSLRKGNSSDGLSVARLKATDVYGPAVSIESWAEAALGKATLEDIDVAYTPDAFDDPRMEGRPKVQTPIRKPGVGVWARKLPAWGFYGRNIRDLHLNRLRLRTSDPTDIRPVVRIDNVEHFRIEHLKHSPVPARTQVVECNQVGTVTQDDTHEDVAAPRMQTKR